MALVPHGDPASLPSSSTAADDSLTALASTAVVVTQKPGQIPSNALTIWKQVSKDLTDEQRTQFASLACNGLEGYLNVLSKEYKDINDKSTATKIMRWLEPLYNVADALKPIVSTAANAAGVPLPMDVVMGGLRIVVTLTGKVPKLRERAIKLLTRMGDKARTLENFGWVLSCNDGFIQKTLLTICADIAMFCQEAASFFDHKGNLLSRFKDKAKILFLDEFSTKLSTYTSNFEKHFEDLRDATLSLIGRNVLSISDSMHRVEQQQEAAFQSGVRRPGDSSMLLGIQDYTTLEELHSHKQRERAEEERRNLRELFDQATTWISSKLDFQTEYRRRCNEHLDGTGEWFLNSRRYTEWKMSDQSEILWVRGSPGCGKSVLSAIAITDLGNNAEPDIGVAFGLCSRDKQREQSLVAVIGSIIGQLLRQCNQLNPKVRDAYLESKSGKVLESEKALDLLNHTTDSFSTVYLVIDALDEFEEPKNLLDGLLTALDNTRFRRKLKILVLSRVESQIGTIFKKIKCNPIEPQQENTDDIKMYISYCLPDAKFSDLRDECFEKADGMFMWVKLLLQVTNARKALTESIRKLIKDLPPGLNAVYDLIFSDLSSHTFHEEAWLVLHWLLKAYRPLKEQELLQAVGGYADVKQVKDIETHNSRQTLIEICQNLIQFDLQRGRFRFIHESVRYYLEQKTPKLPALQRFQEQHKGAHDILASTCLRYLLLEDFGDEIPASITELVTLSRKYDFLEYACRFWGRHVSEGNPDKNTEALSEVIESSPRRELAIQFLLWSPSRPEELWYYPETSTPLHLLSFFNLPTVAANYLDSSDNTVLEVDGKGNTPLQYAVEYGYEDMALLFLSHAQSTEESNLQSVDLYRVVAAASAKGWVKILRRLKEIDPALINTSFNDGQSTALIIACTYQRAIAAEELVTNLGVDPSVQALDGYTALHVAAENKMTGIMLLLINQGAPVNISALNGMTPLHDAAFDDDDKAADAMLKKGADPLVRMENDERTPIHEAALGNAAKVLHIINKRRRGLDFGVKTKSGQTPLHMSAWKNADKSAKALITLGCPKDDIDADGDTALHKAAMVGAVETVEVLVSAECSTTIVNNEGNTALHIAVKDSRIEIITNILASATRGTKKTMLSTRNINGNAPIHLACQAGCERTVRKLITEGADPAAPGRLDSSPLHYAAYYGQGHLAEILLSKTKDPNPINTRKSSPLHLAAAAKQADFINQMIDSCVKLALPIDYATVDDHNMTPLFRAVEAKDHISSKLLLHLTPPNTYNFNSTSNNRLIHLAAYSGDLAMVMFLVEKKYESPVVPGYQGRIPLVHSILNDQLEMFKYLLPWSSASLESVNISGSTVLLTLLRFGRVAMANHLLQSKLEININALDKRKNGALHYAAAARDPVLFQHLLDLGCCSFGPNIWGKTPFHQAVYYGTSSMLEALITKGFDATQSRDKRGYYVDSYAAEAGRTDILQALQDHGVPIGKAAYHGCNAAHAAACGGHVDVLIWLKARGIDIHKPDIENVTPFLVAVNEGYPAAVQYLLNDRSSCLLDRRTWDGATAAILAAKLRRMETLVLLIAAGAKVSQPDGFGYTISALDPDLQNSNPGDLVSDEKKDQMQRETIGRCLHTLSRYQSVEIRDETAVGFKLWLGNLGTALRIHGDFELSRLCDLPQNFEPEASQFYRPPYCDGCLSSLWQRKTFICKSCHVNTHLCKDCHDDYNAADKSAPKALVSLLELEQKVRKIRLSSKELDDIVLVSRAMKMININSNFLTTTWARYEQWEQNYKSKERYPDLPRPGQDWLRLVKECADFIGRSDAESDGDSSKTFDDLRGRYKDFNRSNKPDKECLIFHCKSHEYTEMNKKDYDELKASGIYYDTESGRPTLALFQRIMEKYEIETDVRSLESMETATVTTPAGVVIPGLEVEMNQDPSSTSMADAKSPDGAGSSQVTAIALVAGNIHAVNVFEASQQTQSADGLSELANKTAETMLSEPDEDINSEKLDSEELDSKKLNTKVVIASFALKIADIIQPGVDDSETSQLRSWLVKIIAELD